MTDGPQVIPTTPPLPQPGSDAAPAAGYRASHQPGPSSFRAPVDEMAPPNHSSLAQEVVPLLGTLALTPDRGEAIRVWVGWLKQTLPDSQVRIAWGTNKIEGIFCGRLGRLSSSSETWQKFERDWTPSNQFAASGAPSDNPTPTNTPAAQNTPAAENATGSTSIRSLPEGGWLLELSSGPHALCRFLVSLRSSFDLLPLVQDLAPLCPTVAAVLESRPKRNWLGRLSRPGRRAILPYLGGLAFALSVALFPIHYRAHSSVIVQPQQRRSIAVPFDATLLTSNVAPGDRVQKGQVLFELDRRPLQLELEGLVADLGQSQGRYRSALAQGKVAEAQIAALETEQLQSKIALIEQRLDGLQVRSPIDGVVVSGELTQVIGSPFKMGDALLEIAPLDAMTVEFEVPEYEICYAPVGATASIRFDAAIGEAIDAELSEVFPRAEIRDDSNVFIGRWDFPAPPQWIRPGMRGNAVIYGPRRPVIWPWWRRLQEAGMRAMGW